MRWSILFVCVLLAGCSAKSTEPVDDAGDLKTDGKTSDGKDAAKPATPGKSTRAPNVTYKVLVDESVPLAGSVATGIEESPWTMGVRPQFTLPSDASFSGLYLEIYWDAPTGGVVGGKAGYWAQDLPPMELSQETYGVATAADGETAALWVPADVIAEWSAPSFVVAAADGPNHALYGTATVAATAFFGGVPPAEYTAL